MSTLIKNGRIVDVINYILYDSDILIENKKN